MENQSHETVTAQAPADEVEAQVAEIDAQIRDLEQQNAHLVQVMARAQEESAHHREQAELLRQQLPEFIKNSGQWFADLLIRPDDYSTNSDKLDGTPDALIRRQSQAVYGFSKDLRFPISVEQLGAMIQEQFRLIHAIASCYNKEHCISRNTICAVYAHAIGLKESPFYPSDMKSGYTIRPITDEECQSAIKAIGDAIARCSLDGPNSTPLIAAKVVFETMSKSNYWKELTTKVGKSAKLVYSKVKLYAS
ncbi:MAG: hypothetical protein ACYDBB_05055 [Armatimonadota bacterium]